MRKEGMDNKQNKEQQKIGLRGFIPQKVSNDTVIAVLSALQSHKKRKKQVLKARYSENRVRNAKRYIVHLAEIEKANGYIEDQNKYRDMRFGKKTMAYSGCEIIAVYNALRALEGTHPIPLDDMIASFEENGMVLSGLFGTAPKAMQTYLGELGYQIVTSSNEEVFNQIAKETDTAIVTLYNDRYDIVKEVHTIHISKEKEGFVAHNVYCNGKVVGPEKSVTKLLKKINDGDAKGIYIIGVMKK